MERINRCGAGIMEFLVPWRSSRRWLMYQFIETMKQAPPHSESRPYLYKKVATEPS